MKNPIKIMWIMSAAALVMAAGTNCAGSQQSAQTTTAASPAAAPTAAPVTTAGSNTATAKTAAVKDELDIAIRDASDCLNDNIPKGSKIVILNLESNFANLSEYIIDELIANAINDKNFSVVDRRQLEAIQAEQKFQMSGAVDDKDALAIGKFFGAQTIISGAMREMGGRYRMTVRALAVQTAVVQSQCNQNVVIAAGATLTDLINSGGNRPAGGAATTTSGGTTQTASPPAVAPTAAPITTPPATASGPAIPAEPPIQGTMVPGEGLAGKLEWVTKSADSHNTYIVEVNADESTSPQRFQFSGGINITVVLKGVGGNRTIKLRNNGTMFTIHKNVTFILDNNITLMGHSGNSAPMITLSGGTFKMNPGSTITGNSNGDVNGDGGGVYMRGGETFMNGGTISGNTARYGGGVYIRDGGTFTMNGGTISDNTAKRSGGGVYIYPSYSTFSMKNGIITGNTAREYGGGVYFSYNEGNFIKTGGTITGYTSDQNNGNVVRDADDYILARKGHAVFITERTRKETTAGPNAKMSYNRRGGTTGDWEGSVAPASAPAPVGPAPSKAIRR